MTLNRLEKHNYNEDFILSYNDDSYEGYFYEVNVPDPEIWHSLHNHWPFLTERTNIEKFEKLLANSHDQEEYII